MSHTTQARSDNESSTILQDAIQQCRRRHRLIESITEIVGGLPDAVMILAHAAIDIAIDRYSDTDTPRCNRITNSAFHVINADYATSATAGMEVKP